MGAYESSRCGCLSLGLRGTEAGREDFAGFFEGGRREGTTECGVKRAQSGRRKFKGDIIAAMLSFFRIAFFLPTLWGLCPFQN